MSAPPAAERILHSCCSFPTPPPGGEGGGEELLVTCQPPQGAPSLIPYAPEFSTTYWRRQELKTPAAFHTARVKTVAGKFRDLNLATNLIEKKQKMILPISKKNAEEKK